MIELSGKVALVTGGSRGIGRACAVRLAQAGADVVVNYLTSRGAAEEVAGIVVALGRRALVVKADVSEAADVAAMAELVGSSMGGLDILVSNAATGGFRPLLENTPEQLRTAMATNVEALLHLLRAFVPMLADREERSKVIAVSSLGSRAALPEYGLVGMTKAALESAVRQAARELGPRGLSVNAVVAGAVETDSLRLLPGHEALLAEAAARGCVGDRRLLAEDIADVVAFLASPLADMVQGQCLVVDGGVSITR
jgi:enoyl-[acyl-carrier protein] reductase III